MSHPGRHGAERRQFLLRDQVVLRRLQGRLQVLALGCLLRQPLAGGG